MPTQPVLQAVLRPTVSVRVAVAAVIVVAVAILAYMAGASEANIDVVETPCHSAAGAISCELDGGLTVSVPLDVAWSEPNGTHHSGGRPDCLPAQGQGLTGVVRLGILPVDMDGMAWHQVVWVHCL